jgi:DNA-binding GntR family transcriptional regulator
MLVAYDLAEVGFRPMNDTSPGSAGPDNGRAAEQAYRQIRDQILTGQLPSGQWLREGDLADALGVSRTPVREALRRLTAEGLAQHEPNRGVRVQSWTLDDLDEMYTLRSLLEPFGARLAAARGQVDVDALEELADAMDRWAGSDHPDLEVMTSLNNQFHTMILRGSGHRRLQEMVSTIVQVPLVLRTFSHYSQRALKRSLAHHHEIVEALRASDPDWAESVMRSHVRAAWDTWRPYEDVR